MSNKDFFRILIKLFALQSLIAAVFVVLPSSLSFVNLNDDYWLFSAGVILGSALITILLFFLIVRFPDSLIKAFKLDQGFDNHIFNLGAFTPSAIIQIGIIIVGGLLFTNNIISFITNCYFALEADQHQLFQFAQEGQQLLVSGLTTLLGFWMFTNHNWIASAILKPKNTVDKG